MVPHENVASITELLIGMRIVLAICVTGVTTEAQFFYAIPYAGVQAGFENGAPETIRTSDLLLRRQVLYPLSYGRIN